MSETAARNRSLVERVKPLPQSWKECAIFGMSANSQQDIRRLSEAHRVAFKLNTLNTTEHVSDWYEQFLLLSLRERGTFCTRLTIFKPFSTSYTHLAHISQLNARRQFLTRIMRVVNLLLAAVAKHSIVEYWPSQVLSHTVLMSFARDYNGTLFSDTNDCHSALFWYKEAFFACLTICEHAKRKCAECFTSAICGQSHLLNKIATAWSEGNLAQLAQPPFRTACRQNRSKRLRMKEKKM